MSDLISRQAAIDSPVKMVSEGLEWIPVYYIKELPSVELERLTDDFETIRIHLNAQKEKLCNQQRWEEAEEYQRIIDRLYDVLKKAVERLKELPSAEPEIIRCRDCKHHDGIRCFRWNSTIITGFDDYCSNAERRGEEE